MDHLEEAAARGIAERDDGAFRFAHPLYARAAYTRVPAARRQQLHLDIASSLETLPDSEHHAIEIARHLGAAGDRADPAAVLRWSQTGGDRAWTLLAWDEAARCFECLRKWPASPVFRWRGKRVEEVLRAGYREAITRAQAARKPIESLWICAKEDRFQVYICEGDRQITVLVFTPPPKENEHEPVEELTEDEPILVVKEHDDDDRKVNAHVDVLVPDDKKPIVVHRLKYRPDQPDQ
jgi:hypothetical protein